MKLWISQQLTNIKEEPIVTEKNEPWMLKDALTNACLMTFEGDKPNGDEKYQRYKLANKLDRATDYVDLTAEEISRLKKLCGMIYTTTAVGAIWEALEGRRPPNQAEPAAEAVASIKGN